MFCPMCGAPNEEDATYCANCGAALSADVPPVEPVPAQEALPSADPLWPEEAAPVEEPVNAAFLPPEPVSSAAPRAELIPPPPLPPRPAGPAIASSAPVNGMAVAALVLGIAGLTVLPFISSVFAVIFGYMARREIRQRPAETSGDGVAVAGIVLGWIGVGLLILALVGGTVALCGLCGLFGSSGVQ